MSDKQQVFQLDERVSSVSHKRGLGWPWDNTAAEFGLYDHAIKVEKIRWLFNWEMWKPQGLPGGIEYVPQVRLGNQAAQIDQFLSAVRPSHFIGFNEPEMVSESNMPVSTATSLWKQYVEPAKAKFHFRLGSPAMTSSPKGKAWLRDFFNELGGSSSVDFIVVHWYGSEFHDLESFLEDIHRSFGKPLWLTEFAYSHAGASPTPSSSQVESFMREALPFLDKCSYVERYAYFGAPTNVGSWVGEASNFTSQGHSLTAAGELYLEL